MTAYRNLPDGHVQPYGEPYPQSARNRMTSGSMRHGYRIYPSTLLTCDGSRPHRHPAMLNFFPRRPDDGALPARSTALSTAECCQEQHGHSERRARTSSTRTSTRANRARSSGLGATVRSPAVRRRECMGNAVSSGFENAAPGLPGRGRRCFHIAPAPPVRHWI